MSRDGSGNFTLDVADFASGTTISSSDMNTVLGGIETALTNSIAKNGETPTTARIPFASGISTDTITEVTSAAGVTIDSVLLKDGGATLTAPLTGTAAALSSTLSVTGIASFANGAVGAPSITFSSDPDTGIYRIGADTFGIAAGGTLAASLTGLLAYFANAPSTGTGIIKVGNGRTGDGASLVDLIGDATYTSYGLRLGRNGGANGESYLTHRGTNTLGLVAEDAAPVVIKTTNTERARFAAADSTLTIKANTVTMWNGDGDIPFARISTNAVGALPKRFTSSAQTITAGSSGNLTLAHSLGATPFDVTLWLVAQASPELGYTEGDKVKINTNDSGSSGQNAGVAILADSTNVYVYPGTEIGIVIPHKSTNTLTGIDTTKWKFEVRAWV